MKIYLYGIKNNLGFLNNIYDCASNYEKTTHNTFTYLLYKILNTTDLKLSSYDECDICITSDYTDFKFEYKTYRDDILHLHITCENLYKFGYHIKNRLLISNAKNKLFLGCCQNADNFIYLPMWAIYNKLYSKSTFINDKNFEDRYSNGVCSMFHCKYPHREYIINSYKSNKVSGENKKDIIKNYLFNIAVENTKDPFGYYITEKLPDAIQAGCIPIYWGGNLNNTPFNQDRIINITDLSNLPNISKYSKNQLEDMWNLKPFNCNFDDYCESLIEKSIKKIKERM